MTKYEIRHGSYFLMDGENIVAGMGELISVVISVNESEGTYVMHKHGQKEYAQKWLDNTVKRLKEAGLDDMANEFVMFTGPFPVSELNWLIECTGYTKKFYEKIRNGLMPTEPEVRAFDFE